ncbi:MAG TPA: hypothetical protein VJ437_13095 [Acidiferrobacterales bacterium]|nr:hypothetical protein [Acidiferrobacterales bacterium]
MTTAASWGVEQLRVFEALREHVLMCPLCEGPGTRMPADEVRISNKCERGIVLLSDWFIAKCEADRGGA